MLTSEPHSRFRYRLQLGDIRVEIREARNMQACVFGSGTNRHLTLTWNNPAGNINIHLTREAVTEEYGDERHEQIASVPQDRFFGALLPLVDKLREKRNELISKAPTVEPSLLKRRGYVVFFMEESAREQVVQRIMPKRKSGGKWTNVIDVEAFKDIQQAPEVLGSIRDPALLSMLALRGCTDAVFVQRPHREETLMMLLLRHDSMGNPYWTSFDSDRVERMSVLEMALVPSVLKHLLPSESFEKISTALKLPRIDLDSITGQD